MRSPIAPVPAREVTPVLWFRLEISLAGGWGVCVTRVEWIVLLLLKARCVYIYIRKRIYSSCLFTEKKKEDDCRVKRRPRAVTWEPKHSLLAYYLPAEKLRCQNALMIRQGQRDFLFSSSSFLKIFFYTFGYFFSLSLGVAHSWATILLSWWRTFIITSTPKDVGSRK